MTQLAEQAVQVFVIIVTLYAGPQANFYVGEAPHIFEYKSETECVGDLPRVQSNLVREHPLTAHHYKLECRPKSASTT